MSLYADDAMMSGPGASDAIGRAAIAQVLGGGFKMMNMIDVQHHATSFAVDGNIAIETGTIAQTFQEKGKTAPSTEKSRYLLVFRRQSNGRWLVLRDFYTTPAP